MFYMCPYLDACVFVCLEGEEDAGIRGIVRYVYFIDVDWYPRGDEQIC